MSFVWDSLKSHASGVFPSIHPIPDALPIPCLWNSGCSAGRARLRDVPVPGFWKLGARSQYSQATLRKQRLRDGRFPEMEVPLVTTHFERWIFQEIKHPAMGVPPWPMTMETLISGTPPGQRCGKAMGKAIRTSSAALRLPAGAG